MQYQHPLPNEKLSGNLLPVLPGNAVAASAVTVPDIR